MGLLVRHYDAFSSTPNMGNPAGVVHDAEGLSEAEMQVIAMRVGFNETAFVLASELATCRIRFFTPGHEIPLCGHATVASIISLFDAGKLPAEALPQSVTIETKAGVLPISIRAVDGSDTILVEMTQAKAEFVDFQGDRQALTDSLGIQLSDLHPTLPIVFGSTGTWTLIVPAASLAVVASMTPSSDDFPRVLEQMPRSSIHPFALETIREDADLHGRHFSSPYSRTVEDPITGTASGVMGAYLAKYDRRFCAERGYTFQVEQGFEVDREGRVEVTVLNRTEPFEVKIAGTGVYVKDMML